MLPPLALAGAANFVKTVQGAIILALSAALVALSLYVWGFNIGPIGFDGLTEKLEDCRANLDKVTSARNEQRPITERNIDRADGRQREAKPIADKIREAPIPPDCKTPGLEIMRNEI